MAIEIEKKYRLSEEQRLFVLSSLEEIGAEYAGEDFEENTIYGGGILDEKRAVLRVRKTQDKTILTFKQRIQSEFDIKQQIEYESEVADAEEVGKIVESLGFVPHLIYEKRRKTWKFRQVEIMLDELPFGLFLEIEGSIIAIAEAEMFLDIEEFAAEHETYPSLTLTHGRSRGEFVEARFD